MLKVIMGVTDMYRYVLFDLDGTLTDPFEGITKSVQYALHHFGIEEADLQALAPFIGPPLIDSFEEFYGMTNEEARWCCDKYRERFKVKGLYENIVYPGIPELLASLKKKGIIVAMASSKPEEFCNIILDHFDMKQYFDIVVGSLINETRTKKEEVLEEALRQLGKLGGEELTKDNAAMVGDRKYDVLSANQLGLTSIGVQYGYAPRGELEACNADFLVDTVEKLGLILL